MKSENFIIKILSYFNLENELDDFDRIHQSIKKDIVFKGTNLWILMFAIIVASVGLNMNSTAVIIGAMLISPLMGPINGMGYSIATYDMPLFRQALKNFSFAVFTSLAASTTYFFLSPISTAHSELLARTSPTIYDVLIALFGGLAGIVAISSKQKGNVIPGVAIATALMPPLCTAGYGLATAQFEFLFGAMYLFTINTVFIAISSVAISQILKFPINAEIEDSHKKKINSWISFVIILVAIPSVYFGYDLVQKERFVEGANRYIKIVNIFEGNYLLKSEVNPKNRSILLVYGGLTMNESQKEAIKARIADISLDDTEVIIQQGLSIDAFDEKNSESEKLRTELNRLNMIIQQKESVIDSISAQSLIGKNILDEIKNIYPQIVSCSFAKSSTFLDSKSGSKKTDIVVFTLNKNNLSVKDKEKINQWLKARIDSENIQVFYVK
ncbi:MAG TPA: DUF389 domain-containing protein [Draconibacterium sp.]|nr:DUF389 domain-containing protein [Draconibacterium sp.]